MQWALPVRNEQRCCSAAEWLQEALQKSCKSAGLQQPQILAAVESPLTAINSAFAAVQKIPESRSALQSGCKVASKRQVIFTGNALPLVSTKKRNAGSNNAIIKIHGRGVDKALMRVKTTRKSKCNFFFISQGFWYFAEKKEKFRGIFQGQIHGKISRFRGIFAGKKSKFAEKSADFTGYSREIVKIRRKIGRFRGILAEKSQILKDFQEQVLRKIAQFHGKFLGETSPRNNQ